MAFADLCHNCQSEANLNQDEDGPAAKPDKSTAPASIDDATFNQLGHRPQPPR